MDRLPRMFKLRQKVDAPRLQDVEARVEQLLDQFNLTQKANKGDRIGVTAGSRGIRDQAKILKTIVRRLREAGASPSIVPCMGSHGGGTAEGQAEVLKGLGITEESVGAPVASSMEVSEIGRTKFGTPVLVDTKLCGMDQVIVINRIKPHTDFTGEIESGLLKMMVIGMGKHQGALVTHRLTIRHGFPAVLEETGSIIMKKLPILFGIGIIENQRDETAFIELLEAGNLIQKEKALLEKARNLAPMLPFDQADLLIVDELGKDISGAGMDTHVIGRLSFIGSPKPGRPRITRIFVRDLSPETHGNACGIGMADYTTKRLVEKIDFSSTNINSITSMTPEDARIPIFFERDREAFWAAYQTSGTLNLEELRVLWIKNTLELGTLYASEAYLDEARSDPRLEVVGALLELPFDEEGDLQADWP